MAEGAGPTHIDRHPGVHYAGQWLLGSAIAIVAFVLGSTIDLGLPRLLGHSSEALSGAAVLGISIAFTGTVVSGFFLLIARANALAAENEEAAEARRYVARARDALAAIDVHRKVSKAASR